MFSYINRITLFHTRTVNAAFRTMQTKDTKSVTFLLCISQAATSTIPSDVIMNVPDAIGESGANTILHFRIGTEVPRILPVGPILPIV